MKCFRFGCGEPCIHNDEERRAKLAGKSQFNQKPWDCLDLIRNYTVSSQITGGFFFFFTSENELSNERQFTISNSFFHSADLLKGMTIYRRPIQEGRIALDLLDVLATLLKETDFVSTSSVI